jgi:nickel transport system ATP-binding protein
MSLLSIQQVSKSYHLRSNWTGITRSISAVREVSIALEAGQCLGIIGQSGAGKSTLGRLVLGLESIDQGCIQFLGQDLSRANRQQWRSLRQELQVVFQDSFSAVNPRFSARTIINEPLQNYRKLSSAATTAKIIELLETVGLNASDLDKYPYQFSGGQLQRIAIARAIALKPKLIVLDEPVASLDRVTQTQILKLLRDLKQQFQLAYLLITHDLGAVTYLADRTAVMYQGEVLELIESADLTQLQHPYSQALIAAQLPKHPRDQLQDSTYQKH